MSSADSVSQTKAAGVAEPEVTKVVKTVEDTTVAAPEPEEVKSNGISKEGENGHAAANGSVEHANGSSSEGKESASSDGKKEAEKEESVKEEQNGHGVEGKKSEVSGEKAEKETEDDKEKEDGEPSAKSAKVDQKTEVKAVEGAAVEKEEATTAGSA